MQPVARIVLLSAALLLGAGCASPPALPASAPSSVLNAPLPDFQRPSLEGQAIDTKALRGHIVVVKFFAKHCEPCKRTLPAVEALHKSHPEVMMIGVAEDESADESREVVAQFHLTFPVVHDQSNVLSGRYRVGEMPVTFVADAQGTVRWVGGPEQNEKDIEQAIQALR